MLTQLLLAFVLLPTIATAHEKHDATSSQNIFIPAAVERNFVSIIAQGAYRIIESNGLPDHETGNFPNRNNPNRISAQRHNYRIPLTPKQTGRSTPKNGIIGIALNGIPFEPGTAECYGQARGSRPSPNCQWREEAIVNGRGQLGLDSSNAHVQPNGSYHYHGVPNGMLKAMDDKDVLHIGYAADGFKIYTSRSNSYKPSYKLKSGNRIGGPGGKYTGKYTQDFEYIDNHGDLDDCNGTVVNGDYVYFITQSFPFAPRCLKGTADNSFSRGRPANNTNSRNHNDNRRHPFGHRPPPRF